MNYKTKCKNCGQKRGKHGINCSGNERCPLIDYIGRIVDGYWAKTFFEAEESEVDRLIGFLENENAYGLLY